MFKLADTYEVEDTIPMRDMQPGDIGIVVDAEDYSGHTVMRTLSAGHFEVMDLSQPGIDACWTDQNYLKVKLLPVGSKVMLEVL